MRCSYSSRTSGPCLTTTTRSPRPETDVVYDGYVVYVAAGAACGAGQAFAGFAATPTTPTRARTASIIGTRGKVFLFTFISPSNGTRAACWMKRVATSTQSDSPVPLLTHAFEYAYSWAALDRRRCARSCRRARRHAPRG